MKKKLLIATTLASLSFNLFGQNTVERAQIEKANEQFDSLAKIIEEVDKEVNFLESVTRIFDINQKITELSVQGRTPAEARALQKAFVLKTKIAIYKSLAPLTKNVADEFEAQVNCLVSINKPLLGDPDTDCHFETVNAHLEDGGLAAINRKVQELEAELASTSYQLDSLEEKLDSL